ncbi:MAG TPA: PAS domain S-box protein, partial [Acidimicrobiales bacterium]
MTCHDGVVDPSSHPGFFSTVVENSVYCWGVVDESITITYISPASEQLFGFRPAELVGTSALDLLHPDYRDVAVATLADLLAHPGEGVPVVMGIRHADGSVVHV